ncbi:MAG: transposase [Candidatus Nomurabacteria bacterium]|jgi:putative transposase|nr:transposase [Candidatus Nomurabacteria bacterium]
MAYKNTRREDCDDQFYHVYNRGINKMEIFLGEDDYNYFEKLLTRGLSKEKIYDQFSRQYSNFAGDVEVHSYCLMPNHFHFLLKQKNAGSIEKFMRSINGAYSMCFNRKYKRRGPLFESRYKAVLVKTDPQLTHVSRYIHLNPIGYRIWDHSSYSDFVYEPREWVTTDFVLDMFPSKKAYLDYVDDYEDVKRANDKFKREIGEM